MQITFLLYRYMSCEYAHETKKKQFIFFFIFSICRDPILWNRANLIKHHTTTIEQVLLRYITTHARNIHALWKQRAIIDVTPKMIMLWEGLYYILRKIEEELIKASSFDRETKYYHNAKFNLTFNEAAKGSAN